MRLTAYTVCGVVCFNSDGSLLAGIKSMEISIWNVETTQLIKNRRIFTCQNFENIVKILYGLNDATLICCYGGSSILVLDAVSLDCLAELRGHSGCVKSFCLSPVSTLIASCSNDRTIRIWDPCKSCNHATRDLFGIMSVRFPLALAMGYVLLAADAEVQSFDSIDEASSISYSFDGTRLVSLSWDDVIRIWDPNNGQLIRSFGSCGRGELCCSPCRSLVASIGHDCQLKIWDHDSGKLLASALVEHFGHSSVRVCFSRDGEVVLCSGSNTVASYDSLSCKELKRFCGHLDTITSIQFAPMSLDCGLR
jgi:WD40 repeat protein